MKIKRPILAPPEKEYCVYHDAKDSNPECEKCRLINKSIRRSFIEKKRHEAYLIIFPAWKEYFTNTKTILSAKTTEHELTNFKIKKRAKKNIQKLCPWSGGFGTKIWRDVLNEIANKNSDFIYELPKSNQVKL